MKNAIDAIGEDNGWAQLGGVGSHINNKSPDFDPRMWGATKLSDLAELIPKVEVKRADGGVMVKIIQAKKKAAKKAAK
ncbi:OST-HTH/LOTUS domain-containing protein [Rubritalea marina]|uniref:OST-HTH/LOTUS domain-containing protein n=1 Tax=Rubritalea marina TaxID=361055 RepID=UPI00196A0AEC